MQGEKLSADMEAAGDFVTFFQQFIEDNNYTLNQIFNCDETGLYYKLLPEKTLASSFENSAPGRKKQKERVTINACSNVLGTIKLPLLLIGKYKNPRCFKNISRDTLPVQYANQSNAWMNTTIFTEWFHNKFVPIVQKKLVELGLEPKAVLVLGNCSAHPDETELIAKDGKVIAKYLPPNVTSLVQPMDQGVLESLKRRYRRKILEELIFQDEEGTTIPDYLKSINMLNVSNLIGACWDEIPNKTFQLSWSKIIPSNSEVTETPDMADISRAQTTRTEEQTCTSEAAMEFQMLFEQLGQTLSEDEVSEWISSDLNDQGYVHLSADEIIASIVHQEEQHEEESDDEDSQQDQGAKIIARQ